MFAKRIHLFEFTDQPWCPKVIARFGFDFLATFIKMIKVYNPTAPILTDLMEATGKRDLVVLGAGSGGGILDLLPVLPNDARVTLTDILPDSNFTSTDPRVSYFQRPVDALKIPPELTGIRVMYTAFHHFPPSSAKKLMANVVESAEPVAIFEGGERSVKGILNAALLPFFVLFITPFIKPFRLSRLFFTYIVPVLPLGVLWDGFVSTLRVYSVEEMKDLVRDFQDYDWDIRKIKGSNGQNISIMVGRARQAPQPADFSDGVKRFGLVQ